MVAPCLQPGRCPRPSDGSILQKRSSSYEATPARGMDSPSITARAPFRSNSPLELLPFGSRSFDFCWVRSQCSQVLQGLVDCDDPSIVAIDGDIGRPEMAERVVSQTVARFVRIDMPINNAGVSILASISLQEKPCGSISSRETTAALRGSCCRECQASRAQSYAGNHFASTRHASVADVAHRWAASAGPPAVPHSSNRRLGRDGMTASVKLAT